MISFSEFKDDKINEAYKETSLLQKAWSKYCSNMEQSRKDLSEVKKLLYSIYRDAPTVAQKEMASRIHGNVEGNLQFILEKDRDSSIVKYTYSIDSEIKNLINLPSKEEKIKVGKLPDSVTNFGIDDSLIIAVKRLLDARKITNGYFGDTLSGTYLTQGGSGQSAPREFYTLISFFKSSIDQKDKQKFKNIFLKSTGFTIDFDNYGNVTFNK